MCLRHQRKLGNRHRSRKRRPAALKFIIGNEFCLKKKSRLIKALDNRFYVKFMQLEIGLLHWNRKTSGGHCRWVKAD